MLTLLDPNSPYLKLATSIYTNIHYISNIIFWNHNFSIHHRFFNKINLPTGGKLVGFCISTILPSVLWNFISSHFTVAIIFISNSRSIPLLNNLHMKQTQNPHLKPKPNAFEVSASNTNDVHH